ncbi:hypothetical protein [Streptomyces canus]|nr:hypothetical protein [Streptomyces canus]MCX4859354.1 hypothetical protein [Streptomyces canus]
MHSVSTRDVSQPTRSASTSVPHTSPVTVSRPLNADADTHATRSVSP